MPNLGVITYNSNSLKTNKLPAPFFSFRHKNIFDTYTNKNFIFCQEIRLGTFARECLKKTYHCVISNHGDSRAGGLLTILPPDVAQVLDITQDEAGHVLIVTVALQDGRTTILGNVYGSPKSAANLKEQFIQVFEDNLLKVTSKFPHAEIIVAGDVNAH